MKKQRNPSGKEFKRKGGLGGRNKGISGTTKQQFSRGRKDQKG